jgi:integrating conjugative element protein (TIGR03756 family)
MSPIAILPSSQNKQPSLNCKLQGRTQFQVRLYALMLLAALLLAEPLSADDCIQFRVVGVCIWIVCTPYGCDIDVTVKYGHFNPDVLVRVSNPQGINRVEDPVRTDSHTRNHNNLIYQDAVAVGHPLTGQLYCPSNTSAGTGYFASTVDVPSWRWGGLDALDSATWIPGQREIGRWPRNHWGHVYPRTGWTLQPEPPKSAAVIAQRVGDIITRGGQPHVYRSILGRPIFIADQKLTWSPASLLENSNEEGWWQPTSPTMEDCLLFGADDTPQQTGWGGGRVAEDGTYLHALWRPYTCCEIDDGALIVIDFTPYPFPVKTL